MKKSYIRNVLSTSFLAGALMIGNGAYASNEATDLTKYAGTTPDSPLYVFDQLGEDIQLAFTFDSQKKSELLLSYAKERLAESQTMINENKTQYVNDLTKSYTDTMTKAEDTVSQTISDGSTTDQEKADLSNSLEDVASTEDSLDDSLSKELDDSTKKSLEESTNEAKAVASVVQGIDPSVVQSLRSQDLWYGEIAKVVALSEATGKTTDEITSMLKSGEGFGDIAHQLGMQPKDLAMAVKKNHSKTESGTKKDSSKASDEEKKTEVQKDTQTSTDDQKDNQQVEPDTTTTVKKEETEKTNKPSVPAVEHKQEIKKEVEHKAEEVQKPVHRETEQHMQKQAEKEIKTQEKKQDD